MEIKRILTRCLPRFPRTLLLLGVPQLVVGAPSLHPEQLDPAPSAWAEPIAGVGPLILLIGERSTKQLLPNLRGLHNAFGLSAAPLGLLSIVTSLIRLCGVQRLRAFIGHELEARAVVGLEITRANCAGVHAELVDGYVVRRAGANSQSAVVGAALLEGEFVDGGEIGKEALLQIQACDDFEREKLRNGIPTEVAPVQWCLKIVTENVTKEVVQGVVRMMSEASNFGKDSTDDLRRFESMLGAHFPLSKKKGSPVSPKSPLGHLTFLCTFGAVSEFITSTPRSPLLASLIGALSMTSILVTHCLALWRLVWQPSIGLTMAFCGYIGIVLCVTAAVRLIYSSCTCVILQNCSKISRGWMNGLVIGNSNADSSDTSGCRFLQSPKRSLVFEAVWLKDLTDRRAAAASLVAVLLTASFICHYIGLRSTIWWVSVAELVVCLLAAFTRSITKDKQERFDESANIRIDKRCLSTGVINVQKAEKIDLSMQRMDCLDARAYSMVHSDTRVTMPAEHIAWFVARLCVDDEKVCNGLLSLTGMLLVATTDDQHFAHDSIALIVSFNGGILVTEGLAAPNTRLLLSFHASPQALGAPTSLLARAIMRQPQWLLTHPSPLAIPIGNVHIPSLNSVKNWWTLSEDRNDMGDLQNHLQWAFLLVNVAFFLTLLRDGKKEIVRVVEGEHEIAGSDSQGIAREMVDFLKVFFGGQSQKDGD